MLKSIQKEEKRKKPAKEALLKEKITVSQGPGGEKSKKEKRSQPWTGREFGGWKEGQFLPVRAGYLNYRTDCSLNEQGPVLCMSSSLRYSVTLKQMLAIICISENEAGGSADMACLD